MTEEKKETRSGKIAESNVRMSLVIPKVLKAELDEYSKTQDRSTNKIITYAIREYLMRHRVNTSDES